MVKFYKALLLKLFSLYRRFRFRINIIHFILFFRRIIQFTQPNQIYSHTLPFFVGRNNKKNGYFQNMLIDFVQGTHFFRYLGWQN